MDIKTDQICLENIGPNKKSRKMNKKIKLNDESNKSTENQSISKLYEEMNEAIKSRICLNDDQNKLIIDDSDKIPEIKMKRKRIFRKNRIFLRIKQRSKIKLESNIKNSEKFNQQTNGLNVPELNFDNVFRTCDDDEEKVSEKDDIELTSENDDIEIIPEKGNTKTISKKDDIKIISQNNFKSDSGNDENYSETKFDYNDEEIKTDTKNRFKNIEKKTKDNRRKETRKKHKISKSESFIKNGKEFLSRSMNTRSKDSDPKRMFACFDADSSSNCDSESEINKKSSDEDEQFENLSKKDFYRESQKLFKNFSNLNESNCRSKESSSFGIRFILILIFCFLISQIPGFKNIFN